MAASIEITDRRVGGVRAAPHVLAFALIAIAVAGLWPSLSALARVWLTMADYNYGFLIAAVSVVWLFKTRARLDASSLQPAPWMLAPLAAVVMAWMVAYRANSELMQQMLFPLLAGFSVGAAFGCEALRRMAAPLAFFYFAVPVWEHAVPLLQWLTTQVAEAALGMLGVPTEVEGHHVTIPAGRFSIVEGCSGNRYFVAGLAFAALAGAVHALKPRSLALLAAIASALALVTNWLRVVIIIYAGHLTDMQHYLVAVEHKSLGYAMFVPMLALLAFAALRLRGEGEPQPPPTPSAERGASLAAWTLSALLTLAPAFVWAVQPRSIDVRPSLGSLPVLTGDWEGPLPASGVWTPVFLGPANELRASYAMGPQRIDVYLNAYGVQSPGRELVYHGNSVAPATEWTLVRRGRTLAGVLPMAVYASDASGERWIVAHTYSVGGRITPVPALAQLYYGFGAVWRAKPAGVLALATACDPDCETAERRVEAFWNEHGPSLVDLVPRTF